MPSRAQVLDLVRAGLEYDEIGRRLGVRPGLAYLIATGLPADGGDAPNRPEHEPAGLIGGSQRLANPQPAGNPTTKESVLRWVRSRAASDEPMRRVGERREVSPGKIRTEGVFDVVDVLTRDHNQVKAMLEQMSTIPGKVNGGSVEQMAVRKSIVDTITVALSKHEAVEEEHLWPTVREVLPDGEAWADTALSQEQEGKDLLAALGKLDGDDEEFDELVEKLTLAARTHVAFEEKMFLTLRETMPEDRRSELGRRVHDAHAHAPTRPHPHAPKTQPGVQAAGAAGAAMDKARDTLGKRPADDKGRRDKAGGTGDDGRKG